MYAHFSIPEKDSKTHKIPIIKNSFINYVTIKIQLDIYDGISYIHGMKNKCKEGYVWIHKFGEKKPKKILIKKLIQAVNNESFTQKFFLNEKDAKESIKEEKTNELKK